MNKEDKIDTRKKRTAQQLLVGEDAESPTLYRKNKLPRNKLCPCGSGKKVKNCCGVSQEYGYKKYRPHVTPEGRMKRFRENIPFALGEKVLGSKAFPVEEFRGKEFTIVERGMEERFGNFYFKIMPVEDPDGKVDITLWYSDGHLVKPEDYDEE